MNDETWERLLEEVYSAALEQFNGVPHPQNTDDRLTFAAWRKAIEKFEDEIWDLCY